MKCGVVPWIQTVFVDSVFCVGVPSGLFSSELLSMEKTRKYAQTELISVITKLYPYN